MRPRGMKATIGNRLLRQIAPAKKPYEIHDERIKGFLLRVQPSGTMTYLAQYRRGKRITLGRAGVLTPQEAREEAKMVLGSAMRGIDPKAPRRDYKSHTLASFIEEEFEPWSETHLKSKDANAKRIKMVFSKFLKTHLSDIEPRQVERWRTKRLRAGNKPATINRDLSSLKGALSRAVEWGFIDEHPLSKVRKEKIDTNPIPRYLAKDEAEKLYRALDSREERIRRERASANRWRRDRRVPLLPDLRKVAYADHLKPMVLLSLDTGVRRGELFNLLWTDINFERRILTVRGTDAKSGKTRHIPLNRRSFGVLTDWFRQSSRIDSYVFVGRTGGKFDNVNKSWREVLRLAEVKHYRWHDLRHTFASWLVMNSIDLNTVRELLGHSDLNMTLRYAHLAPEHKAMAVETLETPMLRAHY